MEYGALAYCKCVADDVKPGMVTIGDTAG